MDIDKNSLYYQHISNRSFLHFILVVAGRAEVGDAHGLMV